MKMLIQEGLLARAAGLALVLLHMAGALADRNELFQLSRVDPGHGGINANHSSHEAVARLPSFTTPTSIAAEEKKTPLEIVLEIERRGGAQIVNFSMKEEDVRLIMKRPWVATASDGSAMTKGNTVPHPRNYGCFPRKIGYYALAEKHIPLEQAIRSATGLPADILRLPERGYLKAGYFADVVVFDPKTFRDTATFARPHSYAAGVVSVYVN